MASGSLRGRALVLAPVLAVLAAAVLTGCAAPAERPTSGPAQAVVPTRSAPDPTRTPPPTLAAVPSAGSVQIEDGPFTDRLAFDALTLTPGERPAVIASVSNTVDVSELIVLELRADFYDAQGAYLGSGAATYADEEFADTGAIPLEHGTGVQDNDSFDVSVSSTDVLPAAVSAILTVPQLVNE